MSNHIAVFSPQYISESEVSVYDVKDHPDFQYRPGTVVIRVANFTGTEAKCTAGQVLKKSDQHLYSLYLTDSLRWYRFTLL